MNFEVICKNIVVQMCKYELSTLKAERYLLIFSRYEKTVQVVTCVITLTVLIYTIVC